MKRSLYTRFNFTLFSMFVSGSFLAGFSVKTFYLAVAYGLSGTVRVSFIFGTWKGFIYEITDPMAIIKVMEACYCTGLSKIYTMKKRRIELFRRSLDLPTS